MPAVSLTLYPGSAYDFTFGGAGFGWARNPNPADVDDAFDDPLDPTWGLFQPSVTVPRIFYSEYKLALGVTGIVTIASVRLIAWLMTTGTAGIYDTDVSALIRPSGTGFGAGGAFFSTPITLTSHSSALEVFQSIEFAPWPVNPATTLAWTLSDLAALAFGLRLDADAAVAIGNPSGKHGRLRFIVEATSSPSNTEGVRALGSMPLRLFSRPVRPGKIVGPAALADVGLTETFFLQHSRGRRPGGPGWGTKSWRRRPLVATQKAIDLITGQTTIDRIDLRNRYTRMWFTALTNLGFSQDGQGLPLLHSGGGGPACTRASVKYVEEPGNPTDHVLKGATENVLADDARGYCVEQGDDVNLALNSTFSAGIGNSFDNWTPNTSGTGTVTQDTARVGVDEIGLRRSCRVDVGITDTSVATIAQDIAVSGNFRLAIRFYNDFGAGKLSATFQRSSDSKYWNNPAGTWDVGVVLNRLGGDAGGYAEFASKLMSSSGDTITAESGYFGEAGSVFAGIGFKAVIWALDLAEGVDHIGTPLVTVAAPVARVSDVVRIPNNEVVRWWGFERGFSWSLGFTPLWNAADIASGEVRIILHVDHGDGGYSQILFQKGVESIQDRFVFSIFSGGSTYTAEYVVAGHAELEPMRDRLVKLSGYYIGAEAERDLPVGQIAIAVNDDWIGGVPDILPGAPTMDPVSTGYLGHAFTGVHEIEGGPTGWMNGVVREFDICPFVLYEEELARRPS